MAITQGTVPSYSVVGEKVDISEMIGMVSPAETPLYNMFYSPNEPVASNTHKWLEDSLIARKTTLAAALATDGASCTLSDSDVARAGDILRIIQATTKFVTYFSVSAISGGTLATITSVGGKAFGSSGVSGATVVVESKPAVQGFTASTARWSARGTPVNYTEIFEESVDVTGTELAISRNGGNFGMNDEYAYQMGLRMKELGIRIEQSILSGVTPRAAAASTPGIMGGLMYYINSASKTTSTAAAISEDILAVGLKSIWDSGGQADLIICDGTLKRALSILYTGRITGQQVTLTGGVKVDEIITDFGTVKVLAHRFMPAQEIIMLQSDRVKVLPLAGRSWFHELLGITGDFQKGMIVGEYTLEFKNAADCGYRILGLTNS